MKVCRNCNTPAHSRKARVCHGCGAKAIWREPTQAEIDTERKSREAAERLFQELSR